MTFFFFLYLKCEICSLPYYVTEILIFEYCNGWEFQYGKMRSKLN